MDSSDRSRKSIRFVWVAYNTPARDISSSVIVGIGSVDTSPTREVGLRRSIMFSAVDIMFYKLARCPMNEIHRLIRANVLQTRSEERLFEHVLSTRHQISFGGIYFT